MDNVASLDISLWFECPHCSRSLDLFDDRDCPETACGDSPPLAWSMIEDWLKNKQPNVEATCGRCSKPISIRSIEY